MVPLTGILNLKGYPNCIIDSKVMASLLNGWVLPFCGVASGRVCAQPAKHACYRYDLSTNVRLQAICL